MLYESNEVITKKVQIIRLEKNLIIFDGTGVCHGILFFDAVIPSASAK